MTTHSVTIERCRAGREKGLVPHIQIPANPCLVTIAFPFAKLSATARPSRCSQHPHLLMLDRVGFASLKETIKQVIVKHSLRSRSSDLRILNGTFRWSGLSPYFWQGLPRKMYSGASGAYSGLAGDVSIAGADCGHQGA